MALASVFDRTGGWVNVLHCFEDHYIIDPSLAFLNIEAHLIVSSATRALDFLFVGTHEVTGQEELFERINAMREFRDGDFIGILRRSCDTPLQRAAEDTVYTFQKTYFMAEIPANSTYEHPFQRLEVVQPEAALSLYGLNRVEIPRNFRITVSNLDGSFIIRVEAPRGERWQTGICYGFRFGLFVSIPPGRWPSWLTPTPYPLSFFSYPYASTNRLRTEGILEAVERCRLWFKFSSSSGLQGLKDSLVGEPMSPSVLANLQRHTDIAHSDVWITMRGPMKLRQWLPQHDGFVHFGTTKWLLYGPSREALPFHSYHYKPGTARRFLGTAMRKVATATPLDIGIQPREISLVNRLVVAVACVGPANLAYSLTGSLYRAGFVWILTMLFIFGLELFMSRREPPGWERPFL